MTPVFNHFLFSLSLYFSLSLSLFPSLFLSFYLITSSTVVSSLMRRHLYLDSSMRTLSWMRTSPPFFICRLNLVAIHGYLITWLLWLLITDCAPIVAFSFFRVSTNFDLLKAFARHKNKIKKTEKHMSSVRKP